MAVAVPMIMAFTGASAAIGAAIGVSASLVTVGAGLLTAVSGVGSKIDKAASKVFGSDLVNAANIVGTIAMATGAMPGMGFDGAGPAASVADGVPLSDAGTAAAADPSGYMGPGSAGAGAATDTILDASGKVVSPSGGNGILSRAAGWLDSQPDRTRAALVTIGGQALSGAAQGYSQQKALDKQIDEQRRREAIYNVGHAGTITYGSRRGVLANTGG